MKAGFFGKVRKDTEDQQCLQGKKVWPEQMVDTVIQVFFQILGEKDNLGWNDMERRLRTGAGVREYSDMTSLHGHGHLHGAYGVNPEDIPKDVATHLIEQHSSVSSFRDYVPQIMEQAATILGRVKAKGKADNCMAMDTETEKSVTNDILREVLVRHLLKVINEANSGTYAAGSSDGGLLATPGGYYAGDLNELQGQCIAGLMERGYGYQDDFMGGTSAVDIYSELELLEFDGKFSEVMQQKRMDISSDKIGWFTPDDIDREKQPGLSALFKKLISIPFELNKKCNLCLQGSASFQLACYPKKGFYKKHMDGGYDKINNGRKITAIYYPNHRWSEGDSGNLRIFKRGLNPYELEKLKKEGKEAPDGKEMEKEIHEEMAPKGDRLLLFRSRDMPHEVIPTNIKRFGITMWVMGPPGPGDMPDGYYAPT